MSTHNEASPVPLQLSSVDQDNDQSTYHEIQVDTPVQDENVGGSNPGGARTCSIYVEDI